jgi:hypothetical protein
MLRTIFFHKNQESNEKASILIKMIWSVIIIISLSFIINMFIQPENILRYSLILFLVWTVSLVLIYFAKNGYTYFSAFLYITFLLLMIFGFS